MLEIVQPSAILRCSVHFTIYMYIYLYSYRRETARQLRMYAQRTRCFSAVAELLVLFWYRKLTIARSHCGQHSGSSTAFHVCAWVDLVIIEYRTRL